MNAAENDDDNFLSEAPLGTTRPAVPHLFLVSPVLTSSAASFNSFRASIRRQVALSSGFRVGRPPEWSAEWNTWVKERRKRFWLAGFNVTQLKKKKNLLGKNRVDGRDVPFISPTLCSVVMSSRTQKSAESFLFFSRRFPRTLYFLLFASHFIPPFQDFHDWKTESRVCWEVTRTSTGISRAWRK